MIKAWLDAQGVNSRGRDCLASMGIYLFNRDTLVELLKKSDYEDFGKEIFPMSIRTRHVQVHPFDGYWEDIGTIKSFFESNLALAGSSPPFELAEEESPIYTRARFLPPTRVEDATIRGSLIADGCVIGSGTVIENSVIGLRCLIGRNVTIRDSILMGVDYYDDLDESNSDQETAKPATGVGDGSLIERAIVDKNCRIGANVQIKAVPESMADADVKGVVIRDGITVVPKEATLPDGWTL